MPLGTVTIYMSYLISLFILHNALLESIFIGEFFIYISLAGVIMPLNLHYF